jgi:hypothetical protein
MTTLVAARAWQHVDTLVVPLAGSFSQFQLHSPRGRNASSIWSQYLHMVTMNVARIRADQLCTSVALLRKSEAASMCWRVAFSSRQNSSAISDVSASFPFLPIRAGATHHTAQAHDPAHNDTPCPPLSAHRAEGSDTRVRQTHTHPVSFSSLFLRQSVWRIRVLWISYRLLKKRRLSLRVCVCATCQLDEEAVAIWRCADRRLLGWVSPEAL